MYRHALLRVVWSEMKAVEFQKNNPNKQPEPRGSKYPKRMALGSERHYSFDIWDKRMLHLEKMNLLHGIMRHGLTRP